MLYFCKVLAISSVEPLIYGKQFKLIIQEKITNLKKGLKWLYFQKATEIKNHPNYLNLDIGIEMYDS